MIGKEPAWTRMQTAPFRQVVSSGVELGPPKSRDAVGLGFPHDGTEY